uniref:Uncharacterized protein n=1 Tax=Cacopsylla melanoneura TaxID=428564 RepID=A0A8D9E929_9HEMI
MIGNNNNLKKKSSYTPPYSIRHPPLNPSERQTLLGDSILSFLNKDINIKQNMINHIHIIVHSVPHHTFTPIISSNKHTFTGCSLGPLTFNKESFGVSKITPFFGILSC